MSQIFNYGSWKKKQTQRKQKKGDSNNRIANIH